MRAVFFMILAWVDLRAAMMLPENAKTLTSNGAERAAVQADETPARFDSPVPQSRMRPFLPFARARTFGYSPGRHNVAAAAAQSEFVADVERSTETLGMVVNDGPVGFPQRMAVDNDRFSGSAWILARGDGASASLANGGQLGGSQAGVRLFYQTGVSVLSLTARASTPLATPRGREATLGIAVRGHGFGLIAEQRFALDRGGRTAPSMTAYGGVSDIALGHGLRFDGYVQAGAVGFDNIAGFIDGAARVEHTITEQGRSRLSGGVALSGGAQPGVHRIDVGPQMVARVPVAGTPVRVSAEWRHRIAGNAAPGSGPAVTVGVDF